jgi:hypothetical protein
MLTIVENIKKSEDECTRICEDGAQFWTNLVEGPKMNPVETRLRDVQEKAWKDLERINTLPHVEQMRTILEQRKLYDEIKSYSTSRRSYNSD